MNIFIVLFILLINIINIFAMYKLLGKDIGKKEKIIFIAVGVAVMYMLVSAVYWLSSIGMDQNAADAGRDFITFTFVPVNGLCVLTFLSSSYKKYKAGHLKPNILRNRCVVLVAVLVILLIVEFFYFKNIQNNALEMVRDNTTNNIKKNLTQENTQVNAQVNNENSNNTSIENQLENEMSINSEQTNTSSENVEEIENVTSTNAEIINSTTVDSSVNTTVENNVLQ